MAGCPLRQHQEEVPDHRPHQGRHQDLAAQPGQPLGVCRLPPLLQVRHLPIIQGPWLVPYPGLGFDQAGILPKRVNYIFSMLKHQVCYLIFVPTRATNVTFIKQPLFQL